MKSLLPAVALAGALLLVGVGASLVPTLTRADQSAPDAAPEPHAHAGGHGGAGAHAWERGSGAVPDLATALASLDRRGPIVIRGDEGFNPANGVRAGSGSFEDPFVISGWYVDEILVADTTKAFVVRENHVVGRIVLDWTGAGGYVHHNHIGNLRTNRNVDRVGDPTAAVIEKNVILRVEELRHFDGILRNNTIGREGPLGLVGPRVVLNIAGLNGAGIHDNVIHGGVDMKLHGHHHSDRPGEHSHNHGAPDVVENETQAHAARENHQVRYVDFAFRRNVIKDDAFGLRYNDLDHAGDDRQATSEQEPDLELPHVHHTSVTIADNVIEGATLRLVVVNAQDERHISGGGAHVNVLRNRIVQPLAGDGLVLEFVKDAVVLVEGNVVEKGDLQLAGRSGILLREFANSTIHLVGNEMGAYRYGIRAAVFAEDVRWIVARNRADASEYPVYWDASVPNPPEAEDEAMHDHAHGEAHAPRNEVAQRVQPFDVRHTALM